MKEMRRGAHAGECVENGLEHTRLEARESGQTNHLSLETRRFSCFRPHGQANEITVIASALASKNKEG